MRVFLILVLVIVTANASPYSDETLRELKQGMVQHFPAEDFDSLRDVNIELNYVCGKNSPSNPYYSTGKPPVMLSHIFCGQIAQGNKAQGFHSEYAGTNWSVCARKGSCNYYGTGNGYCNGIEIRGTGGIWYAKSSGSSMWRSDLSTTGLVTILENVSNGCGAERSKVTCARSCNYKGKNNLFDIFLKLDSQGRVTTAYPTRPSKCTGDKYCDNKCTDLAVA